MDYVICNNGIINVKYVIELIIFNIYLVYMKNKIKNGISYKKNGWKYISVKGRAKERGYAYGYFCADDFKEIQKMLNFYMFESYGFFWDYFIEHINKDFKEKTKTEFYELYEEMEGIAEGCKANGCNTTVDEIIAWNFYMSIPYWLSSATGSHIGKEGGGKTPIDIVLPFANNHTSDKCSAFIANGDWTTDGKIVVGHNSFSDYIDGQYSNIILDLHPEKGYRFLMQTSPCWIWSGTDFFITSVGIIGTETTIGGFTLYEKRIPIGYRIRQAMQYATNIDEYVTFLTNGNSGDYANSWLIGDIKTNEIARIELGFKYHNVSKTKNGYFIGFNATYDPRIRNIGVVNSGFYDIRRHQGARRVRLTQLLEKYKGKLNIEIAKKILADHYDVYLKKDNNPCSRTVCSHYDLDAREYMSQGARPPPFAPHGAVDGMVCDSNLAKSMSFVGRYGNSCGIAFNKDKYCKEHIQYSNICHFLKNRPSQPWTKFQVYKFDNKHYAEFLNSKKKYISNTKNIDTFKEIILPNKYNIYASQNGLFDNNKNIKTKYFENNDLNYVTQKSLIAKLSYNKSKNLNKFKQNLKNKTKKIKRTK